MSILTQLDVCLIKVAASTVGLWGILHIMGGCQNYGPFLGALHIRCRTIMGNPKRDHNFDNHPYGGRSKGRVSERSLGSDTCAVSLLALRL